MASSKDYWQKREAENLKKNLKTEEEYSKAINDCYEYMMDNIQKEINGFYAKYAKKEGITLAEARKRVSKLDIEAYERKAAKYVKEKNFSDQANEEMRLYNLTMKVNRLEMLKANIGLELVDGFDGLQKYFDQILTERSLQEFERMAGILGGTVRNNAKYAHAIVNASFANATYSDRIWMYQDMLKSELSKLLMEGMIQGKNPRQLAVHLRKRFGVSEYNAERLMRTELARVQIEAQKQSLEKNGFEDYQFICNGTACGICKELNGKHFKIKDMEIAVNAPPMHPNCRCSIAAWMDSEEYEEWLDYLDNGGTTEDWEKLKLSKSKEFLANQNTNDKIKSGIGMKDALVFALALPKYKDAVIPRAKFTHYALEPEKDPDKTEAFRLALGYTKENADELIKQIYENLPYYDAIEKGNRGWGMTYEVIMDITGPNGKTAKVLTAWIDDNASGEMRLTTVHVD